MTNTFVIKNKTSKKTKKKNYNGGARHPKTAILSNKNKNQLTKQTQNAPKQ